MEKHSALGLSRNTTSTSGYASASVCSVNSASACVNRDLRWLRPIPNFRKPIKKTPRLDAGCQRGSLGNRRSALSTAWLALPHVDPARNQGPRPTPCPDPHVWGISGPCACGMGGLCSVWKPANLMGPASFSFSSNFAPPVVGPGDGLWSLPTTPLITTRDSTNRGGKSTPTVLSWTSFPLIVPNSTRSNECGSSHAVAACIIATSKILRDIISAVETEFANWTRRDDVLRRLCAIT